MNRHLIGWLVSVFWPAFALCVISGLGPLGTGSFFPPVAASAAVGFWWLSRSLDWRARALVATPVPAKRYATLFWAFAVLSLPALHTLQKSVPGALGLGDPNWTWILRRAVLFTGAAASVSLAGGLLPAFATSRSPLGWTRTLARRFLQFLLLGCCLGFASLMARNEPAWDPLMTLGLLSSVALTVSSFVAREAAWSPARRLASRGTAITKSSREPDTMPTRFWPVHFLWMWRTHLLLGVSLGLLFLVTNELFHLLADRSIDGIWVFALLLTGCADVTRALDVHTVRFMPISRLRQAGLFLAYPVTAFVTSLLMVPVGCAWYGWDPLHALGIVLAAMSVHGVCTATQIVTEEPFFVLLAGLLFLGAVLLFVAVPWPVAFYYVVTALFGSAAVIAVYILLGSSTAYHRDRWDARTFERVR